MSMHLYMDIVVTVKKREAMNLRKCEEGIHGMGRGEGKEEEKLCGYILILKLNIYF